MKLDFRLRNKEQESCLKEFGYYSYKQGHIKQEDKVIVFLSHIQTFPNVQGNRVYINRLLSWLRKQGFKVVFIYQSLGNKEFLPHMEESVDALYLVNSSFDFGSHPDRLSNIDYYCDETKKALEHVLDSNNVEAVIANYTHMASYLREVPSSIKKMVLTIDALYKLAFLPFKLDANRMCSYEEEKELLSFSDIVLAINDTEAIIFKEMFKGSKSILKIGMPSLLNKNPKPVIKNKGGKTIVFCAASQNPMNVAGVKGFILDCWNKLYKKNPNLELRIAGPVCQYLKDIEKESLKGVFLLGCLPSLEGEILKSSIFINPVQEGTGLKIKTIEGLSYGKAFVSYPSGVDGMEALEESGIIVCRTSEQMTKEILDISLSQEKIKELEKKAKAYSKKYLNEDYIYRELKNFLFSENVFFKYFLKKIRDVFVRG